MSFPKLVVEHVEYKEFGIGYVINEIIKDTITEDIVVNEETGQENTVQLIKEVSRLSVIWENVPNPAINYHGSDELIFKAFYEDIENNEYDIETILEHIDSITVNADTVNVDELKNALRTEFGDELEDDEINDDTEIDNVVDVSPDDIA